MTEHAKINPGDTQPAPGLAPGAIWFAVTHTSAGGLREIWADVAEGLRGRGYRVGLLALYRGGNVDSGSADPLWHRLEESRPRGIAAQFRAMARLYRFLRRERPAVIVTAMPAANVLIPVLVTAVGALAGLRTRVIITHHSPADTHNPLLDRLDGMTGSLPCVRAVISVSHAVATSLAHKPRRYLAKSRVITNALPERIEKLIDQLAGQSRTASGSRRIVAVGRLTRQKNYPMMVRAMTQVPDAVLEIVGEGEDREELVALAQDCGAAQSVRFLGQIQREAALAVAASADVFVQVSLFEGHSLALIEAARLGLPLIVSNAPVQVEGITARDGTRCGIVIPIGDHAALARSVVELLDDPGLYARMARLARRLGAESSSAAMIDRYENLIGSFGANA
jgi:glycosyltransferase involved in cell wall biosynthesis